MRAYQVKVPALLTTIADMVTLSGGGQVTIKNEHESVAVLIGGEENQTKDAGPGTNLSATTGFLLNAGKTLTVDIWSGETIYGISSNATVSCSVTVIRTRSQSGGQGYA